MTFVLTVVIVVIGLNYAAQASPSGTLYPQADGTRVLGELLLCVSFVLFLSFIWLGVQALTTILTTEFAVTNRRVIAKVGFIRRRTLEILLSKVESIAVQQPILGRILDFGTITVTGTGGTRESFRAIVGPIVVRKNINHIIEYYTQAYDQQQRLANNQPGV